MQTTEIVQTSGITPAETLSAPTKPTKLTEEQIHTKLTNLIIAVRILSNDICSDPKMIRSYNGRALLTRLDRTVRNLTRAKVYNAKMS